MKQVALGFRAHSGWTALVAISLEEDLPLVILRERPIKNAVIPFVLRC